MLSRILVAMALWERVKCDVLQWNAELQGRRRLTLAPLVVPDVPRAPNSTEGQIRSMAGRIFLPALDGGEPFWDWNWPVSRLWEG